MKSLLLMVSMVGFAAIGNAQTTFTTAASASHATDPKGTMPMITFKSSSAGGGTSKLGGVEITVGAVHIRADEAEIDPTSRDYELRGNVHVILGH